MSLHTRRSALDKINAGLWLFKFARILEISLPLMFGLLCIDAWVSLLYLPLYLFCVSYSLFHFDDSLCKRNLSQGEGYSTKFYKERLRPTAQPHYPFTYNFWQKRKPFPTLCLLLTNGTPFTYIV